MIHPQAIVSPEARIGADVEIGPFSVIEGDTTIGDRSTLASHVVVRSGTDIGPNNQIGEGAVLGGMPQHSHAPRIVGRISVGSENVIREHVTIHRSFHADEVTRVGDRCLLMVGCHVAHDCHVGNDVVMANNTLLAGHVVVANRAYLGGACAVHQFCRIGQLAMVGGMSHLTQDVLPFVMVDGESSLVVGLNRVGLRRAGMTTEDIAQLKQAYRMVYRSRLTRDEMLTDLAARFATGPAAEFHPFLESCERGFVRERRVPPGATVRLVRDEDDLTADNHRRAG